MVGRGLRIFCHVNLAIAAALGVLSVLAIWNGLTTRAEDDRTLAARFLVMDVDLSRPGKYEGSIHQDCNPEYPTVLTLEVDPPVSWSAWDNALAGLVARYEVPQACGITDSIRGTTHDRLYSRHVHRSLILSDIVLISQGEIPFALVVEKPIRQLAGRKQTLIGKYDLINEGDRSLAASVLMAYAFGGLALFLLVGIPLLWYVRRMRGEGRL